MYNKTSRVSAILLLVSVVLLVGFLAMLPNLQYQTEQGGAEAIGAAFLVLISVVLGYLPTYIISIIYAIVALVFGIRMLVEKTRDKLIKFNRRILIASCVLLPFFVFGLVMSGGMIAGSQLGVFPTIYTILVAIAYVANIVTQIVTLVKLKKSPEEPILTVDE